MKIRIGNDFVFNWAIERGGLPEDLSSVLEKHLHLSVFGKKVELVEGVDYDITGNVIRIEVTPTIANIIGIYRAEFKYILSDNGFIDEDRKCEIDVDAFQIVAKTAQADESSEFSVTSDMAIAFKGDKGDSAYQVWLDAGNIGTEEDYFAYLRQPAVDAGASISELEGEIQVSEGLRVSAESERDLAEGVRLSNEQSRVDAEGLRVSGEVTRNTAEGIRVGNENTRIENEGIRLLAEEDRVDAEETRVENEALRISAELLREGAESDREDAEQLRQTNTSTAIQNANEATQNANSAAELANTKAGEANTAAQNADDARLAIEGDLELKANHGYSSNPKTLKQVDDSLVQLAGDVSLKANKTQEAWITPTLLNGWIDFATDTPVSYMKDDMGFVHIRGAVKTGTYGFIFALPLGYRPTNYIRLITRLSGNGIGRIDINPGSGYVSTLSADSFVSLDNIVFKID